MQRAELEPRLHLLVCTNRRAPGDPLGGGCGDRGDALYAELKARVAGRGDARAVWVTRTYCLGVCPKSGATVAAHGAGELRVFSEVEPRDSTELLSLGAVANGREA